MKPPGDVIPVIKQPVVYVLASGERGTLFVGVTGSLKHRVWEHREGLLGGFTKKYGVKRLVWLETFADFPTAITRETQIKKWNRLWKIELKRRIPSGGICGRICWNENRDGFPLSRE